MGNGKVMVDTVGNKVTSIYRNGEVFKGEGSFPDLLTEMRKKNKNPISKGLVI